MPRYCLEQSGLFGIAVIHDERCDELDIATLLCSGDVYSVGEFASPDAALTSREAQNPKVVLCHLCCVPTSIAHLSETASFAGCRYGRNDSNACGVMPRAVAAHLT